MSTSARVRIASRERVSRKHAGNDQLLENFIARNCRLPYRGGRAHTCPQNAPHAQVPIESRERIERKFGGNDRGIGKYRKKKTLSAVSGRPSLRVSRARKSHRPDARKMSRSARVPVGSRFRPRREKSVGITRCWKSRRSKTAGSRSGGGGITVWIPKKSRPPGPGPGASSVTESGGRTEPPPDVCKDAPRSKNYPKGEINRRGSIPSAKLRPLKVFGPDPHRITEPELERHVDIGK